MAINLSFVLGICFRIHNIFGDAVRPGYPRARVLQRVLVTVMLPLALAMAPLLLPLLSAGHPSAFGVGFLLRGLVHDYIVT